MVAMVTGLHEIVFFPMIYQSEASFLERIKQWGCWEEEKGLFDRRDGLPPDPYCEVDGIARQDIVRFGENVFYHPFVQRFLYGHGDKQTPVRVWQRKNGPARLRLRLMDKDQWSCWQRDAATDFQVCRTSLYWFNLDEGASEASATPQERFGIAILALEIAKTDQPMAVQYAQELLDRFRRIYPPYFEKGHGGRIPYEVEWQDAYAQPCHKAPPSRTDGRRCLDWVKTYHNTRVSYPVLEHWRWLLANVWEEAESTKAMEGLTIMEDERLPLMAWVACDDPRGITRQDFVRLCFADDGGRTDAYPYAPVFLDTFEADHCYDRYWVERPDGVHDWMNTRFMTSGYAFVTVGKNDPGFYADGTSGLLSHFRNHYFLMGLILHFQKTALLAFSDRLSENITRLADDKQRGQKEAKRIRRDLLHFTSRYWFTDMTSQLQGQELHDLWQQQLRLPTLYEQVMGEARELNEWLDMENEQQLSSTMARLTTVATLGLAASLALATLGLSADVWWKSIAIFPTSKIGLLDLLTNAAIVFAAWVVLTGVVVWCSRNIHRGLEWLSGRGD